MAFEGGADRAIAMLPANFGSRLLQFLGRKPDQQLAIDPGLAFDVGEEIAFDASAGFKIDITADKPGLGIGALEPAGNELALDRRDVAPISAGACRERSP